MHTGLKNASDSEAGSGKIKVTILSVLVFLLTLALIYPLETHAGMFSSFLGFISGSKVHAENVEEDSGPNAQNMALLQATISPSTSSHATSTDSAIISGNSLSPETVGPLSDGKDHISIGQDQISLYVVRKGDTLPEIAQMFGVSTNTIRWGNDLKGNTVTPGQTLVILPISGVEHTVKSGDTLQSIAKQYKGDLNEILQYNNLTKDSKLAIGDTIIIPDGEVGPSNSSSGSSSGSTGSIGSSSGPGNGNGVVIPLMGSCSKYPSLVGYFMRPVTNCIKTQGIHGHNGIDLAGAYGANILAAASGDVIVSKNSGWNGGYGSYVVIKHDNGTQTLYGHLSATEVSVGDHVVQGDVIGKMGSTGDSTGTHLHFEIRGARNPF